MNNIVIELIKGVLMLLVIAILLVKVTLTFVIWTYGAPHPYQIHMLVTMLILTKVLFMSCNAIERVQ